MQLSASISAVVFLLSKLNSGIINGLGDFKEFRIEVSCDYSGSHEFKSAAG